MSKKTNCSSIINPSEDGRLMSVSFDVTPKKETIENNKSTDYEKRTDYENDNENDNDTDNENLTAIDNANVENNEILDPPNNKMYVNQIMFQLGCFPN